MPYEWLTARPEPGAPLAELHAWPYRSLPRSGYAGFIGATAAGLGILMVAVVGSPILWGLLPFALGALLAIWWALSHSYRTGEAMEILKLWPDRVTLLRTDPGKADRHWSANPHWVRVQMDSTAQPPCYLTLHGGPRVVELGAFLTPDERRRLYGELRAELTRANGN